MIIEKRDGTLEQFNLSKIRNAISNVLEEKDINTVLTKIEKNLPKKDKVTVEEIQDIVEKTLMSLKFFEQGKSYILYRKQRENIRNSKTSLTKTFKEVLDADGSDISRENANVDGKAPMGLMLLFGSEIEKDYVKRYMISPKFTELHDNGDIHIHDLNMYACTFNCCNIGLKELFRKGFNTGHGTLRPPQSISTALTQAAIVVQANQNDMYGGQGIPLFDYELSPYIAKTLGSNIKDTIESVLGQEIDFNFKDFCYSLCEKNNSSLVDESLKELESKIYEFVGDKTKKVLELSRKRTFKDTFQACEGFVHNLNSLNSRAGSQVPFSSINYGTNTTPEGQMLIENTLEATEEGLGNGETSIFPVQIFKIKEGVNANPGDPNYYLLEKAVEVTSKRMYPNFVNIDVPGNIEYYQEGKPETEMATMGALSCSSSVELFNFTVPPCDINFKTKLFFNEVEDYLVKNNLVGEPIQFDKDTVYYNTDGVYIHDSDFGGEVKVKKFMIFKTTQQWYRIHCVLHNKGYTMDWHFDASEDHPLPVMGKGRTFVSDLKEGDFISASLGTGWESVEVIKKEKLNIQKTGYDFETESDKFDTDYIVSHNCRTKTLAMMDGTGRVTNRGNIAFTTINLPRLGILAAF